MVNKKLEQNELPKLHPYLQAIIHYLSNEKIEIHFGLTKTVLKQADADVNLKSILVGTVKEAFGDCLILDINGTNSYVNVWQIHNIIPIKDKKFIRDVYIDEHQVK